MKTLRRQLAGVALAGALGISGAAHADAVTDWNEIAVRAATIGRPGLPGLFDLALMHTAVHDAVQSIEGRYEPYHATVEGATGEPAAAVAAAAHAVLVGLYPAQSAALDADYMGYLLVHGLDGDAGLAVGETAAALALGSYRPVPNPPLPPFVGGTEPGAWRPTPSLQGNPPAPPSFAPMAFYFMAYTEPFTLLESSQFRPQPPPPMTSERYRRDFDEVRAKGPRFGASRTPEETDLALFWTDNYVAQWNRTLRGIATAHVGDLGESARLFALANLVLSDAAIACWDAKVHYNFWRPITAIRDAHLDGNARTAPDPSWEPLINTPNYPDYASGANTLTAAVTTILASVLGTDELAFTISSNAPGVGGRIRAYESFSAVADEVVEARILLGIHFRFSDEEARRQGERIGHWAFHKYLRPLPEGGR